MIRPHERVRRQAVATRSSSKTAGRSDGRENASLFYCSDRSAGILLAALVVFPAGAAPCKPADPSLAGHYVLRGVMEVGSELLLKSDGRFNYMLAYGALDELASGCWMRSGNTVTLHAYEFKANMDDPGKFERLDLTVAPGGKLTRRFDDEHKGTYAR